jgi:hypothetical protein
MSPELKPRLKGIIFLGTPHQGTLFNRYGLVASYILAPLGSDIDIMRILGPGSGDLYDLHADFQKYFKDSTRKYFFEKEETCHQLWGFNVGTQEFVGSSVIAALTMLLIFVQVVTKLSATWGADSPDAIGLDADHRSLNRFKGRDNNYKLVSREILAMLQKKTEIPYAGKIAPMQLRIVH